MFDPNDLFRLLRIGIQIKKLYIYARACVVVMLESFHDLRWGIFAYLSMDSVVTGKHWWPCST